jgi:probable HAF family extracellular repeat protein
LQGVTQANFATLNGSEFAGNGGGNNSNGPVLNSFTLDITEGATVRLSDSNFSITNESSQDFFSLQQGSVVGGQFEVFNGSNWVEAQTGGFTIGQIESGLVEFVQDGSATAPDFTISVSNGSNVSGSISPTVNFTPADVWDSTANNWSDGTHWSDGSSPVAGETVEIPGGNPQIESGTVNLDDNAVHNSGTIEVASGAILMLSDGTTVLGGQLTLDASTSTLDIHGGSVSETVTLDAVSTSGGGSVQVDAGADLILTDGTTLAGVTLSIGVSGEVEIENGADGSAATLQFPPIYNQDTLQIDAGATLLLTNDLILYDGGHVTMLAASEITGAETFQNIDNTISGTGTIGGGNQGMTLTNDGVIDANISGQQIVLNTGNTITNNGLMEGTNGGDLVIDDNLNNFGTGSVVADGGTVTLGAAASIGGTFEVMDGGVAEIVLSSEQDVTFAGTGTVLLDNANNYRNGIVGGFAAGDTIDLANLTYSPSATYLWDQSAGTLTISNGVGLPDIIHLAGSYTQSDFALIGDAPGGTSGGIDVVFNAPPSITAPQSGTTASDFVTMDYPGADQVNGDGTFAYGINNSGAIVGGYTIDSQHTSGFEYNGGYSAIGVAGSVDNNADGINNFGEIAGFNSPVRSTPRYGFTDNGGSYTEINLPGDGSTTANGINDAGVVVGAVYFHGTPIYSGYIDNLGTITYLDASGTGSSSDYTDAEAINDAGQVVGVFTATYGSNNHGFLYQIGTNTYTTIDDPNGVGTTQAYGINNSGEIVGAYVDGSGKTHGFIDVNDTFTTIDDPLGTNTTLTGINDAG